MNFTNRENNSRQIKSNEQNRRQNKPYKNPFAKKNENASLSSLQNNNQDTFQLKETEENKPNIDNVEEFPGLPSLKKASSTYPLPTKTTNSWSSVAKENVDNVENVVFTSKKPVNKYSRYIQEQEKIRRQLQELTIEQLRRDKLNEELGEDSPYWGEKSLLNNDTDTDESSYASDMD
jgi:hypothetical protein